MKRRLLVLCYFYPPLAGGGVHRVLSFTRELPALGWDCTVVCAGPGDYWVTDESLESKIPPGTEVLRVEGGSPVSAWLRLRRGDRGRRPSGLFNVLRPLSDWWNLPDPYAPWGARARAVAGERVRRGGIDAVLSSSPPDTMHLVAHDLVQRHPRLPWIADFRDPWMGLHFRQPPTAWHRRRQQEMERRVLERADLTVVASKTHAEIAGSRSGARPRRLLHLPNGFEPAPRDGGEVAEAPRANAVGESFEVVWTGTLSQMPDTEVFLDALHDVLARAPQARRKIRVRFAGPYETGYEDRAIALGLKGIVEFLGPCSHAASRALQRRADLLVLWKPRAFPTMVPGKLYEYLDSGRPLLAVLPAGEEATDLARRAGASMVLPGDRAALTDALRRHYEGWAKSGRAADARPEWLGEFERSRLAGRLAAELDALQGVRA